MTSANRLQKVFGIFLVVVALLFTPAFIGSNRVQAFAKPLTPEAAAYEIDHADNAETAGRRLQEEADNHKKEIVKGPAPAREAIEGATENTVSAFQRLTETVREKLNLDEPVPQSTKDFLNDGKESVNQLVNPVTGK